MEGKELGRERGGSSLKGLFMVGFTGMFGGRGSHVLVPALSKVNPICILETS